RRSRRYVVAHPWAVRSGGSADAVPAVRRFGSDRTAGRFRAGCLRSVVERMSLLALALILATPILVFAQPLSIPPPSARELERANYHRVTARRSPAPEPRAEDTPIISPLAKPGGGQVRDVREWLEVRRPQL